MEHGYCFFVFHHLILQRHDLLFVHVGLDQDGAFSAVEGVELCPLLFAQDFEILHFICQGQIFFIPVLQFYFKHLLLSFQYLDATLLLEYLGGITRLLRIQVNQRFPGFVQLALLALGQVLQLVDLVAGSFVFFEELALDGVEVVEVLLDMYTQQCLLLLPEGVDILLSFVCLVVEDGLLELIRQPLVLRLKVIDLTPQASLELVHPLLLLRRFQLELGHGLEAVIVEGEYQFLMIGFAAVLLEDGEDFPDTGLQLVLLCGLLEALSQEFIEADGVDEEGAVYAVYVGLGDFFCVERSPIYPVPHQRHMSTRLKNNSRNIEHFSLAQTPINPRLNSLGAETDLKAIVALVAIPESRLIVS